MTRQRRIECPDGGSATVNLARGVLTVAQTDVAAAVVLDEVAAMQLAEALTDYVASTIGETNAQVVRGANAAIAKLTDLAKCRPER